jgi:hypothetical protein
MRSNDLSVATVGPVVGDDRQTPMSGELIYEYTPPVATWRRPYVYFPENSPP